QKRIDMGEPAWGAARQIPSEGDAEIMPKAVRYDEFGGIDVLRVEEVERPVPGDGQVLVRVKAAGINISEAVIRGRREARGEDRRGDSGWPRRRGPRRAGRPDR